MGNHIIIPRIVNITIERVAVVADVMRHFVLYAVLGLYRMGPWVILCGRVGGCNS